MNQLKAILNKKQKELNLKSREVLKVMKRSNNLINEFNNAMYTLHNAQDKKRVDLILEIGKNGNWYNREAIKEKMDEVEKSKVKKNINQ